MTPTPIPIGQRFGLLTVLAQAASRPAHPGGKCNGRRVLARCDCGTEWEPTLSGVLRGGVKSCGCLRKQNHAGGKVANETIPRVKATYARNDMARIGAVRMAWDGRPMLLAELAEMIGEPEIAQWAGLLLPWVEAIHTDAGPLVYARTCGSDEVRAAVAKHTRCEGDEDSADAVEWRLESEAA